VGVLFAMLDYACGCEVSAAAAWHSPSVKCCVSVLSAAGMWQALGLVDVLGSCVLCGTAAAAAGSAAKLLIVGDV
jgi:hypothetical protein